MLKIKDQILISEDELAFRFSRSSGPGGQNINKVSSRATLLFDVVNAKSFSGSQKKQILKHLARRADKNGIIRVVSQKFRTQRANRRAAIERLVELLREALKTKAVRKRTKVPAVAKQRRLEEKKRRSLLKKQRAQKFLAEDIAD